MSLFNWGSSHASYPRVGSTDQAGRSRGVWWLGDQRVIAPVERFIAAVDNTSTGVGKTSESLHDKPVAFMMSSVIASQVSRWIEEHKAVTPWKLS